MGIKINLFFIAVFSFNVNAVGNIAEIPNPNLPDIAMVTVDGYGNPVILFNPMLCQQAGPELCEFYRWHEYGHIMMGHTIIQKWPQIKELEADCWAAKNAPQYALQAAYNWFMAGGGASLIHGFVVRSAQIE